jgi:hypothetical protein
MDGLLLPLSSFTHKYPFCNPGYDGAKLTFIVQLAPAARLRGQFVVQGKSEYPLTDMLPSAPVPVFFRVNACEALLLPITVVGNVKVDGVRVAIPVL